MEEFGSIGAFLALGAAFIMVFFIGALIWYVLNAIGLYKIAKKEGNENAWFAWVPVLNVLLLPMLVNNDVHESIRGNFVIIYIVSLVASMFLGGIIPFVALVPFALFVYGFYILLSRYSKNAVVHTVIAGVTLGVSAPIQFLYIMNREPLSE